jgi:poly(hydroxyalkanoate) depolymerase family esterase
MKSSNDTLRHAMHLMQAGDLHAATRAIQQGLGGNAAPVRRPFRHDAPAPAAREDCIEAEFHVVDGGAAAADDRPTVGPAPRRPSARMGDWLRPGGGNRRARHGLAPGASPKRDAAGDPAFRHHRFACDAGDLDYMLYVPAGLDTERAPLLVMLHGCTQTPDDFARGTRMNRLAVEHGYVVAYPAQSTERNPNRCWNWFRGSDQQRGHGEPAVLAALTRHLVASLRLDAGRVHVAGLSAGGAMAAVLASTHPELYAAIGVHSGLPIGLASDVPSAFAAMRKGGGRRRAVPTATDPVPAIVFHGDGDTTVHPRNGDGVIEQSLGTGQRSAPGTTASSVERGTAAGGRGYTRTVHRTADGRVAAEHWVVHGAAHAWSGGDASGSYTDPDGPDASAQMLRFFESLRRERTG